PHGVLETYEQQFPCRLRIGKGPYRNVHTVSVAIRLDPQVFYCRRLFLHCRILDGRAQIQLQSLASHIDDIGAEVSLCRPEVLPGVAVHIDDVSFHIRYYGRWGKGLEEYAFCKLGKVSLVLPAGEITGYFFGRFAAPRIALCKEGMG